MRYETRTVRIGEWSTDGTVEEWLASHATSRAPALSDEQVEMLRTLLSGGRWGVQRASMVVHEVIHVGLYDGWAYWAPRVCVLVDGTLGSEVVEMYEVRHIYPLQPCRCHEVPSLRGGHAMLCRGWRVVMGPS